jgi:hypothetical protein
MKGGCSRIRGLWLAFDRVGRRLSGRCGPQGTEFSGSAGFDEIASSLRFSQ